MSKDERVLRDIWARLGGAPALFEADRELCERVYRHALARAERDRSDVHYEIARGIEIMLGRQP